MGKFDGVLLVSDLDATLLTDDKRVSAENRAAIDRFVAEGGIFTYVTGRTPLGCRVILDQFTPDAPIGCLNGGGIYDAKTDTYLWSLPLDAKAEELVAFVRSEFPHVGIELCGFYEAWFANMNPLTELHRRLEGIPYVEATYKEVADRMAKVLLITEAERLGELKQALLSHPLAEQFDFIQSTSEYYEILPKGAGKGALMLRMADMFGISHEKTVAVGDNVNDVSMIEAAGLGVAVANATDEAKAVADLVLDSTNEQHAIADLIRRLETENLF